LCREIDRRIVGFRKVKWHSGDPWNDLEDRLAITGRNQQSREVVIQLIFRAVIDKKEQFVRFDRFSVQSHVNIHDFRPRLVEKCGNVIGQPEDYEIRHERHKLEWPLEIGEQYEIIARTTTGYVNPSVLRA
jgi:hypothetical protein